MCGTEAIVGLILLGGLFMSDDTKLILSLLDRQFEKIDKRFDGIDERLDRMDERFDGIDERFDRLEGRVDKLEESATSLQLAVENEIRPSIQLLAEGHMMLNEKLDRVLENAKDTEELKTRVDALEAGFRQMQDKIDKSA